MPLSLKEILTLVFSYPISVEFVFVKVGLMERTKSNCSVGRCCASFPSQLLPDSLHLSLLLFLHCISLRQKCGVFIGRSKICWVLRWNLHNFFPVQSLNQGFGRWEADIASHPVWTDGEVVKHQTFLPLFILFCTQKTYIVHSESPFLNNLAKDIC